MPTFRISRQMLTAVLFLIPLASAFVGPSAGPGFHARTIINDNDQNQDSKVFVPSREGTSVSAANGRMFSDMGHKLDDLFAQSANAFAKPSWDSTTLQKRENIFSRIGNFFGDLFESAIDGLVVREEAHTLQNSQAEVKRLLRQANKAIGNADAALAMAEALTDAWEVSEQFGVAETAVGGSIATENMVQPAFQSVHEADLDHINGRAAGAMEAVVSEKDAKKSNRADSANGEEKLSLSFQQERDWSELTVPQLKAELKLRGLKVSGRKAGLIARLTEHDEELQSAVMAGKIEEIMQNSNGNVHHSNALVERPDWSSMTVAQLKVELKNRGLAITGRKAEMITRLEWHEDTLQNTAESNIEEQDDKPTARSHFAASEEPAKSSEAEQVDFSDFTMAQLKAELRSRGLRVSGRKVDLIERLQCA